MSWKLFNALLTKIWILILDFDEAAESAVEKRKLLLNRVVQEKLLPDESNGDEEAEDEVEASVWYIVLAMWFL